MNQTLGLSHFFHNADGVALGILVIMFIMSAGTWYVIVHKTITNILEQKRSDEFLKKFWAAESLAGVDRLLQQEGPKEPFARLVEQGLSAKNLHGSTPPHDLIHAGSSEDYLTRTLKRSIEDDSLHIESGLSFVATVASSAPFIGLLGTVWGIYNALIAIGISGQGTLDKVAGPVGEALIMTGIGLVVAIPAVMGYNYFARRNRGTLAKLESFAHDVYSLISRGVMTNPVRKLGGK